MAIWQCRFCLYRYDEEVEGVLFEDLPDSWTCPECNAPKKYFLEVKSS